MSETHRRRPFERRFPRRTRRLGGKGNGAVDFGRVGRGERGDRRDLNRRPYR